jgi:DNA-binding SARP family transcriptional activator
MRLAAVDTRIYLTGRVAIETGGDVVVRERQFRGQQDRVLFAYLVCERARPIAREELAAMLWPEETPPAWQVSLSALVSRLRRLLDTDELRARGAGISQEFGQYQLHLPADAWVDLEAAASYLDAAEGALRAGEPKRGFGAATVAAGIGARPFLSGADGPWVEAQRRKLERQRVRALECLAHIWLASSEPLLAVEAADEALAVDPYRETAHQLLMRAHALAGNPAEAVRAYHRLRETLAADLGTDPTKETEAVYLEVLG